MKPRLSSAPLLAAVFCSAAALAQQSAPARSPEIHADRRVTFRLLAPKATEVRLTGEFAKDPLALTKDAQGVWSVTTGPLAPEIYEYEYWVDGIGMLDPGNPAIKHNSRPGVASSLLEVPGAAPAFYDTRRVPHGSVQMRWYISKSLDATRRVHIYTPPGYERGSTRYPVLYLLHGADGDDSVWTAFGRANHILDNLIADKKLAPVVVAMPFGYAYPPMGGVEPARQRAGFERDLTEDLVAFVESNYRVHADRNHRALVGLSMGAGQALSIGLNRLELFSRVAAFSGAGANPQDAFKNLSSKANEQLKLLWIGCGTEDAGFNRVKDFSGFLNKAGVKHTFRSTEGAHTWLVWRRYLNEVAPLLFP
jgi:enterochelin esterase-like enzyme